MLLVLSMSGSGPHDIRDLPKPADIEAALDEAIERLQPEEGTVALIGGVALAVFGVERFTKDVDLAVTIAQSGRVLQRFSDADPRPLRIGGVSVLTSSGTRVDFIDRRHEYRALFEAAIHAAHLHGPRVRVRNRFVSAVPLAFLIALKLAADRPQDEADLQALLQNPELDYPQARNLVHVHVGYFAARRLDRMARALGRKDAPREYENGEPYGSPLKPA